MENTIIENDGSEQTNVPVTEESLMSLEKLDRTSPDLWPEDSINKFIVQNLPQTEIPVWSSDLSPDDNNQVYRLGNLTVNELVLEVKKLLDEAYKLGFEEAKEMTRGKYLNIFKQK